MIKYFLQWLEKRSLEKDKRNVDLAMHRDYYQRCEVEAEDGGGYGSIIIFGGHNHQALETTRKKFNNPNFIPDGYHKGIKITIEECPIDGIKNT